jgi:hypothetical protein
MRPWNSRFLMLALLSLALGACTIRDGSNATARSPEAVHRQWIEALRANQRDVLLDLAAPQDLREAFVDAKLQDIQDLLRRDDHGAFSGVDTTPLVDLGANKQGVSTWRFADGASYCFRAELTAIEGRWAVLHFGGLFRCP